MKNTKAVANLFRSTRTPLLARVRAERLYAAAEKASGSEAARIAHIASAMVEHGHLLASLRDQDLERVQSHYAARNAELRSVGL